MNKKLLVIASAALLISLALWFGYSDTSVNVASNETAIEPNLSKRGNTNIEEKPSNESQEFLDKLQPELEPTSAEDDQAAVIECGAELEEKLDAILSKQESQLPFESFDDGQSDTPLKASFEYLIDLSEANLDDLVAQGSRDAMTLRGTQLLDHPDPVNIKRGRDLLYQAGVLGSSFSLAGLGVSYYEEYLLALETSDLAVAKLAYQNFHNTQYLLKNVSPLLMPAESEFDEALLNSELVSASDTLKAQETSLEIYNENRRQNGLPIIGSSAVDPDALSARVIARTINECLLQYQEAPID